MEILSAFGKFLSVITLTLGNALITLAMVITKPGSEVSELSGWYKLISLSLGVVALIVALRKQRFVFLFIFSVAQFVSFLFFASYLNNLRR